MGNESQHRIVVLHPGANAQIVRRLQGVAHAIGCTLFVAIDATTAAQLCSRKPSDNSTLITLILPQSACCDDLSTDNLNVRVMAWNDLDLVTLPPFKDGRQLVCQGNPITLTDVATWMRCLSMADPSTHWTTKLGWGTSVKSWSRPALDLKRELKTFLRLLRVGQSPALKTWLSLLDDMAHAAAGRIKTNIDLQATSDGNKIIFNLTTAHTTLDSAALTEKLARLDNSIHIVSIQQDEMIISGSISISQTRAKSAGVVIVIQNAEIAAEQPKLEEAG